MPGARRAAARVVGVCSAALAVAAFSLPVGAAAAPSTTPAPPSITVEAPHGTTFTVHGTGWPANVLVELEVCGAKATSGSADCALDTAQVVASNAHGTFEGRLSIVVPPSPCPCVVRAVSQSTTAAAVAAVDVPNANTSVSGGGTVGSPSTRRLQVDHVRLRGSDSLATWLGARPRRTLEFEVVNTGTTDVSGATISFVAGAEADPTGFVRPVRMDPLRVGERRAFSVPIAFRSLAFGRQRVRATVEGASVVATFDTTTSTHPWLLLALAVLVVLGGPSIAARRWLKRRARATEPVADRAAGALDDDALICVIELVEPDPDADADAEAEAEPDPDADAARPPHRPPAVRHHTVVLRSIAAVHALVTETLSVEDVAPVEEEREAHEPAGDVATNVLHRSLDFRIINTITVLADADLRVGEAFHACDELCAWIEAAYADSDHPAARSLTLRRTNSSPVNPGSTPAGLGLVPLSVLVRTSQVRSMV